MPAESYQNSLMIVFSIWMCVFLIEKTKELLYTIIIIDITVFVNTHYFEQNTEKIGKQMIENSI